MIDPQITRRFQSEAAFQEEKLRNLFRIIYRDEIEACEAWRRTCEGRGFKAALSTLKDRPARFGKLQGKARFGFLKNRAFDEREAALKEVGYQAERWNSAQMQFAQHKARIEEAQQPTQETPQREGTRPTPEQNQEQQR